MWSIKYSGICFSERMLKWKWLRYRKPLMPGRRFITSTVLVLVWKRSCIKEWGRKFEYMLVEETQTRCYKIEVSTECVGCELTEENEEWRGETQGWCEMKHYHHSCSKDFEGVWTCKTYKYGVNNWRVGDVGFWGWKTHRKFLRHQVEWCQ